MKKYNYTSEVIPQESRKEINEKILSIINSDDLQGITQEDIFNAYTGIGGLHGLKKSDYSNYHSFSEAKKEIEQGQFFTPHVICEHITNLLTPESNDLIADISCGIGNFFNYFTEENCYGWDIDVNAIKVAKFLYPKAHIQKEDMRFAKVDIKMDYVIGNPPFNINLVDIESNKNVKSQFLFFMKSAEILKPNGILLCVVPESFLQDEFFNKTDIENIENEFNFIGQYKLKPDTFRQFGVSSFKTKVMAWQKKLVSDVDISYIADNFISYEELKLRIESAIETKKLNKLKIRQELSNDHGDEFNYTLQKYLFEFKTSKHLKHQWGWAEGMVDKFNTQKCPKDMDYEYWHKNIRISSKSLLNILKRKIKNQNPKPERDEIKIIKTKNSFKLRAYSKKTKTLLRKKSLTISDWDIIKKLKLNREYFELELKEWKINDLVTGLVETPIFLQDSKYLNRRFDKYINQITPFNKQSICTDLEEKLNTYTFKNPKGVDCYFNDIQKHDLNKLCQKQYGILNWKMGVGKTASSVFFAKLNPLKNTFVLSASLAINLTWIPYCKINGMNYVVIKKLSDIDQIKDGDWILLSFHFLSKYQKQIKKFIKLKSQKVNLIFDESDEITNNNSNKTKKTLDVFRRVERKILATGTTTRNNIGELYSQFELLYNNSVNMMSWSEFYYIENRKSDGLDRKPNKYFEKPFPPYYGQTTFRRCFNPSKSTVFGIQKQNQDIYNEPDLRKLIEYTIITRTFKEVAGNKYKILNRRVKQDLSERNVYRKVIRELDEILPLYFESTGNSRKDALLRTLRQLNLLIDATSKPQSFSFYSGSGVPSKAKEIIKLIEEFPKEKIAIGCTSLYTTDWYKNYLTYNSPKRPIFYINGEISFQNRKKIIAEFETTENGILVCTQQSLKSSVNIPTCNKVIIESLQWNIPKIEQFYFRFIRFDSEENTDVYFINYENTIELNILALLMAKEKLNDYVKSLDYKDDSEVYEEYDIDLDILNSLITKEKDDNGKVSISWGESKKVA